MTYTVYPALTGSKGWRRAGKKTARKHQWGMKKTPTDGSLTLLEKYGLFSFKILCKQ